MIEAVMNRSIDEILHDEEVVDKALAQGIEAALLRHKRSGDTIVIWHDDRIVHVKGEDITLDDETNHRIS